MRTYVARLRQRPHDRDEPVTRPVTRPRVYLLVVHPGELDRAEFDVLVERGRQAFDGGDFASAAESFDRALRLWRGRPGRRS